MVGRQVCLKAGTDGGWAGISKVGQEQTVGGQVCLKSGRHRWWAAGMSGGHRWWVGKGMLNRYDRAQRW